MIFRNGVWDLPKGKTEVDENIRQLIISKLYPDQFLTFILERNKNIYAQKENESIEKR